MYPNVSMAESWRYSAKLVLAISESTLNLIVYQMELNSTRAVFKKNLIQFANSNLNYILDYFYI